MDDVVRSGLLVDARLDEFLAAEVLAPIALDPSAFWRAYADLLTDLGPRNESLLRRRDELQALCDSWHETHNGVGDPQAYLAFLRKIGYLEPEPAEFRIGVRGVDAEISQIAGPQLVVPLSNARFALNATNARWGSLYDAIYGSNVIADAAGCERGDSYNPVRGRRVIDLVGQFLDAAIPLEAGRHGEVVEISLTLGSALPTFVLRDGSKTGLRDAGQFVGFRAIGAGMALLFRNHGLHLEVQVDRDHPIGREHQAGIADVLLESAVTTIQDCEDSVAAIDAEDKLVIYRNWLGLMSGVLEATFEKNGMPFTRRLHDDRIYEHPDGSVLRLSGRSLLLVRNVGLHMMTEAVRTADGAATPEGILDAAVTAAIGTHDLRGLGRHRNSATGSIYVVKPKLHGSAEVQFTVDLFARIEEMLGLPACSVKLGIMDEERRTSLNLAACIAAARDRLIFINTGFLDRTGDEIHTVMSAGAVVRKDAMRSAVWLRTYEDRNVDIGLHAGLKGVAQIGKGMWAMPDAMAEMVEAKVVHPRSGASCAWVPSPTAATLHAMHYHQVDVAARQEELAERAMAPIEGLLEPPLLDTVLSQDEIQEELENNAQSILGYVVRWVDQGIGCSKVPDLRGVALMEDRATLRISSQLLANWLMHGLIDEARIRGAFRKISAVVDIQNHDDPAYRPMAVEPERHPAMQAALELVLEGRERANGYTEPALNRWRRAVKDGAR